MSVVSARGAWLAFAAVAAMMLDVVLTFLVAPDAALFNARLTSRIFYYHVPSAWIAYLAFAVTAVASAWRLWRGGDASDMTAHASAEAGVLFSSIAMVTGLLWSTVEFGGSYRAIEDPTVLSLGVVILSYAAYLALRAGVEEREKRARLAAVFGILAFIGVPLSYFAIKASVHPDFTRPEQTLAPELGVVLLYSTIAFTLLYAALVRARFALLDAERRIIELEEN